VEQKYECKTRHIVILIQGKGESHETLTVRIVHRSVHEAIMRQCQWASKSSALIFHRFCESIPKVVVDKSPLESFAAMLWSLSSEKSDRRLYVDALFRKTNMFAPHLPASCLELGDYGVVTNTGEFIRSGNVFQEHPLLVDTLGQGKESFGSNKHFIASRTRRKDTYSAITT
jgi:hypothetical protein